MKRSFKKYNKLILAGISLILLLIANSWKIRETNIILSAKSQNKTLPVCVNLNNWQKNDMYFYLLAALKKYSIKVISKTDADDLSYFEMKSVYDEYYRTHTSDKVDFEEIKRRAASQMSYVANVLEVKCKLDTLTNTLDSIKVTVVPIPYNHGNPYKSNWVYLDKRKEAPTVELFKELIDSVISKKMLIIGK